MPIRDCKRRGHGWLAGYTDIGWSNSLDCYEGFCLLAAVDPIGLITGFCWSELCQHRRPANGGDLPRRESLIEPQAYQRGLDLLGGPYIADKGFEGALKTTGGSSKATGNK